MQKFIFFLKKRFCVNDRIKLDDSTMIICAITKKSGKQILGLQRIKNLCISNLNIKQKISDKVSSF